MKIVKTSAIAFTLSAMLAGPVLAQGAGSTTPPSGMTQQGGAMQRGPAGGADTEMNAQTPGAKAGAATKGTVGSGSGGTARGTAGATGRAAPEAAPNGLDAGGAASTTKRH
ncbi:hypothetical protein FNL55_21575 [Tardiphaga sp. vice352]|uniref:hypothetical protein n=1 Tax=unclassified Tardiphaga TaxID=2631404 RepID=UPI0011642EB1|nr:MULTISPECIES: hypothetical protein [unclassified Tardiphaga]MBC7583870.1 hypothetical protein [Tardiphaga sp.]QDM18319.1 hypothetical protein FNL53_22090 [Tardiphaga sp. vice278]QDM23324.1 hypothetical protein FIU28_20890 [Tardiphaga sp. vice154]QDM28544.1 hypothetical protein FNL56_22325 [Tardiphaga sp. vice304]QDM33643.1 hypothetical protein FNL55_21575 [Tardiphaga sp. vice352]